MARKRPVKDANHEAEVLTASVDPVDTGGEDPAIRAVLDPSFITKSNVEALDIGLALQQLIRGNASLLEQQGQLGDQIARLAGRMDKYDQAEVAWKKDQKTFIAETIARSSKVKGVGDKAARLRAKGIKEFQNEIAQAKVVNASNRVRFEQDLQKMPQVDLIVAGRIEMHSRNGTATADLMPEEIRIRHKVWILRPGISYKVPRIVADRYRQIMLDRQENVERQTLLDGSQRDTVVAAGMAAISSKYGVKAEAFPIASS